ncbi:MAG: zinc ribbon domain-containing protein [Peptococcaceae bacterium]|nr:zinc ribbon domain-containing protein [Peptococcaceae bacterium]
MPTYDYRCDTCGKTFDKFVPLVERDAVECPVCGTKPVKRLFTGGSFMKGSSASSCAKSAGCGSAGFS